MPYLAIVAYRCLVAGLPTESLDIQVQWYETQDEASVRAAIADQPIERYQNSDDETVSWVLVDVMAVEPFAPKTSGEEVIGFISSVNGLGDLA